MNENIKTERCQHVTGLIYIYMEPLGTDSNIYAQILPGRWALVHNASIS